MYINIFNPFQLKEDKWGLKLMLIVPIKYVNPIQILSHSFTTWKATKSNIDLSNF